MATSTGEWSCLFRGRAEGEDGTAFSAMGRAGGGSAGRRRRWFSGGRVCGWFD
ncbi:MAG: hypothetical protein ACR2N0_14915 [Rubrobacteraceae bacterium]|nr:hypothetical protein [Rubrobacter sp.]